MILVRWTSYAGFPAFTCCSMFAACPSNRSPARSTNSAGSTPSPYASQNKRNRRARSGSSSDPNGSNHAGG